MTQTTTIVYGPKAAFKQRSAQRLALHFGIENNNVFEDEEPMLTEIRQAGPGLVLLESKVAAKKLAEHLDENGFPAQVVSFYAAIRECEAEIDTNTETAKALSEFLAEHGTSVQVRMGRFLILHGNVKFATAWLRECGLKNADIVAPHLQQLAKAADEGHEKIIGMHNSCLIGELFKRTRAVYKG
jgi:hypothetical protein